MPVTKIEINGSLVGIIGLDACFEEVRSLGMADGESVKELLLRKVKEENYVPTSMEASYKEALFAEYRIFTGEIERQSQAPAFARIRLYGSSCFRCERLDEMVKDVLSRAGIRADYLHIGDIRETAQAGIMTTPALTVNGKIILAGRVPSPDQPEKMLLAALDAHENT